MSLERMEESVRETEWKERSQGNKIQRKIRNREKHFVQRNKKRCF
jgi:hypothetical protein